MLVIRFQVLISRLAWRWGLSSFSLVCGWLLISVLLVVCWIDRDHENHNSPSRCDKGTWNSLSFLYVNC